MDESLARKVRERAGYVCEYCHVPQAYRLLPFEIGHIIAKHHSGKAILSNLALACFHWNGHKGPNISGIDTVTSRTKLVHLFNPRRHKWDHHFRYEGAVLVGKTPVGRVTIKVLAMNDPNVVRLREMLIREGVFRP